MKPATALPWKSDKRTINGVEIGATVPLSAHGVHVAEVGYGDGPLSFVNGADGEAVTRATSRQNADYIAHACNAYPRLVAELQRLCVAIPKQLGSNKPMSNALLHELGEQ